MFVGNEVGSSGYRTITRHGNQNQSSVLNQVLGLEIMLSSIRICSFLTSVLRLELSKQTVSP